MGKLVREYKEEWRSMYQRLTRIEHDAWQPRLAMEADGPPHTKTRERTEGAVSTVQAMHGGSCSANRVDPDPMCSISFCDDCTGPPTPPCSGENALIDNGAATPKSCLPLLEMRTTTAADGFLPTGETFTATKTTFDHPTLRLCLTEETNLRTSSPPVLYDSSLWKNNLFAAPSCRRVIEIKSEQNRMFDPGCSQGRLRVYPLWDRGVRDFVGWFLLGLDEAAAFFGGSVIRGVVLIPTN